MKKYALLFCCFVAIGLSSCKKSLDINVDKTFVEKDGKGGELGFGGIILTLMPDGKADFLNSGDVVDRGTYQVKGNQVVLDVNQKSYKFKVISETELRYEDRILLLQ